MIQSFQRTTKNGRSIKTNGLPVYSIPVEVRLKNLRKQLNQGLSKVDGIWANISREISATC